MAGDWIKMRTNLRRHPKVVRMASALNADKLRIVGGLHAVWSVFDEHSEDGILIGYTSVSMDTEIGCVGFCAAMIAVNWLNDTGESLEIPRSDAHNGVSAKRRAQETERKKEARSVPKMSAPDADEMRTREEKRREENKEQQQEHVQPKAARAIPAHSSSRFDEFWDAYPVRKGKADAMSKWKAKGYDKIADQIIADVVKRKAQDRQWRDGYAPHGSTYINARGWEDDVEQEKLNAKAAPVPGSADDYFLRAD